MSKAKIAVAVVLLLGIGGCIKLMVDASDASARAQEAVLVQQQAAQVAAEARRKIDEERCAKLTKARRAKDVECVALDCDADLELARLAIEKMVAPGMNACLVQLAWGKPKDVNSTIYARHSREQWVYGSGQYVYLDDGKVAAIQQ